MRRGIVGSARMEGVGNTQGVTQGIMDSTSNDAVIKRAMILWGVALAALIAFHVGGARL